jgi:ribonuclease HI
MNLIIHIDGGSRGNPGPAAAGVVIQTDDGVTVHEAGYFLGRMTNNVAEYSGLLRALELAVEHKAQRVRVYSDSQLMVRQITGEYRVKSEDLKPLFEKAQELLLQLPAWEIQHVRREKNKRADELVNLALDRKRDMTMENGQAFAAEPDDEIEPVQGYERKWTATFATRVPFECPAMCDPDRDYAFGPTTPDGMCVHAAEVILEEGPLVWPDDQREGKTWCPRCRVEVLLKRVDASGR